MQALDCLKAYQDQIVEIILRGNPMIENLSLMAYHHGVRTALRGVKILDQQPVRKLINFNLPSARAAVALPPEKGSFADSDQNKALCEQFLRQYFQVFDTGRQSLVDAYHEACCFSLALHSRISFGSMPKQYTNYDRDLVKLNPTLCTTGTAAAAKRAANKRDEVKSLLQRGRIHVIHCLDLLPKTRHDFNAMTFDTFLLPSKTGLQLLQVVVRGSFLEVEAGTIRQFHRVFLLATGGKWKVQIVNDNL